MLAGSLARMKNEMICLPIQFFCRKLKLDFEMSDFQRSSFEDPYPVLMTHTLFCVSSSSVTCLTITWDGKLISGSADGTVKLWSTATRNCMKTTDHKG